MVNLPPYGIVTETNNGKLTEEGNSTLPTLSSVEKDVVNEATILFFGSKSYAGNTQTCKSDFGCDSRSSEKMVEMNTSLQINNAQGSTVGSNSMQEQDIARQGHPDRVIKATENNCPGLQDGRTRNLLRISDEFDLDNRPVGMSPGGLANMKICGSLDLNENNEQTHLLSPMKGSLLQDVHDLRKSKDTHALVLNSSSQCKGHDQSNTGLMKGGQKNMRAPISVCTDSLERLKTMAENKLQPLGKFVMDSAMGIRNSLQGEKERFQLELCKVSEASLVRSVASKRKGKEKVASDGNMNDGYGSFESCNSAGLFGAEKRQVLNFKEQVTIGCKRVKLQIEESPGSTPFTERDGSFLNWISTLIKGLSRPDEDRALSLVDVSNDNEKKGLFACSREQGDKSGNKGFQSLFQSLYQSNPKVQDQILLNFDNPQISEGCKELGIGKKPIEDINTAGTSSPDDLTALQQKMVSNESLNQSVFAGGQDPLTYPSILKGHVASVPFDHKTSTLFKRFSSVQNSAAVGGEGSSQESTVKKQKKDNSRDRGFGFLFEEKLVDDLVKEGNPLSHLCMTQISPKSSAPIMKECAVGGLESPGDLSGLVHNPQNNVGCLKDKKDMDTQGHSSEEPTNSSCKKFPNFPLGVEVSCVMKGGEGRKVNPIIHSQRFKSSGAIASIFAKRLVALKHVLPTEVPDKAASSATTCFFCGIIGHDLQDCSQVTEAELDEILKKMTAYDGAEESPAFCIRCFQLSHWAVSCPNASSMK